MHYTVNYSNLPKAEKQARAVADVVSYLGESLYSKVQAMIQESFKTLPPRRAIRRSLFILGFVGVRGYPVRACIRAIVKKDA